MTNIPTIKPHGAREIECTCVCGFTITDPRCAVLVDNVLAITCPACDHHITVNVKPWRKP